MSWGQRYVQEELDSYEGTMHSNCGLGQRRVPTELSEIGRIEGSMTELIGISRSKDLLQSLLGSVVSSLYDRSQGDWFEDASITDLAAGGQQMKRGSPADEVGTLCDNERGARRWALSSGEHDERRGALHLYEVGATPISDEVALALLDPGAGEAVLDKEEAPL
ncbi:uncharacterized protein UBRO_20052 [Ustilago bromivora]|uniref:Uncharacterized protein n=1 Tax=Ustilago bromivora TaxID=307758 RepID=A0A1K0FYA3_9BASI|nr:uncharacterized protein UBRO_20052 [Ustilago bromivora]